MLEPDLAAEGDDEDVAAIRRRAEDLAVRHPEYREKLLAFAEYHAGAHAHIAEHLVDAVWVLQRSASDSAPQTPE